MSPTERIFKKDYTFQLVRLAENDVVTAKALVKSAGIRPENILIHIEQTIEKAIKAVICFAGLPVPLSHDILAILQKLPQDDLPPGGYTLHDLTPFATVRRYVEGVDLIQPEEVEKALKLAGEVLEWAKKRTEAKK